MSINSDHEHAATPVSDECVSAADGALPPSALSIAARLFAIDYRSLALFRVMLGLTVAYDLYTQWPSFRTFHLAGGAVDGEALATYYEGVRNWSVFWLSDAVSFRLGLFALAAVAAVCLLVGWYARVAAAVAWALITSLHEDAPALTSAADGLLVLLLFWAIFLPVNRRWAVNARRLPLPPAPRGLLWPRRACYCKWA